MTKEEIRTEARSPEIAPINGDGGGSLKSTASSCPASPPIKDEIATSQRPSPGGSKSWPWVLNRKCRTTRAITIAKNAVSMANQSWFVKTLANTRPARPPPNAPVRIIAITLAEAKPLVRDKFYLLSFEIAQQRPSHHPAMRLV
jgi:hypothetical protein